MEYWEKQEAKHDSIKIIRVTINHLCLSIHIPVLVPLSLQQRHLWVKAALIPLLLPPPIAFLKEDEELEGEEGALKGSTGRSLGRRGARPARTPVLSCPSHPPSHLSGKRPLIPAAKQSACCVQPLAAGASSLCHRPRCPQICEELSWWTKLNTSHYY